jgi:hypothetical protein
MPIPAAAPALLVSGATWTVGLNGRLEHPVLAGATADAVATWSGCCQEFALTLVVNGPVQEVGLRMNGLRAA